MKVQNYIEKKICRNKLCKYSDKKKLTFKCKKLLLGCGAFQTSKILFNSEK